MNSEFIFVKIIWNNPSIFIWTPYLIIFISYDSVSFVTKAIFRSIRTFSVSN